MGSKYFQEKLSSYANGIRFSWEARLVLILVERWGMVQGVTGEEDSAGRAKLQLMPVQETVDRAVKFAHSTREALESAGWIEPGITFDEYKIVAPMVKRIAEGFSLYQKDDENLQKAMKQAKELDLV